jgi:hypothetical protein
LYRMKVSCCCGEKLVCSEEWVRHEAGGIEKFTPE